MRFGPLSYADNVLLNFNNTQSHLANTAKQLSSGLRINTAADDPSGLAIAESLRSVSQGLQEGQHSIQNARNALTVAEGAMQTITEILQRMRSLIVEANSDLYDANDKADIQSELDQLSTEVNRIAANANFNGKTLLDGSLANGSNKPAYWLFVQDPNTDGTGANPALPTGPAAGPPIIDKTNDTAHTNYLPSGAENSELMITVDSYDATSGNVNLTLTQQSQDPGFGSQPLVTSITVPEGTSLLWGFLPAQLGIGDGNNLPFGLPLGNIYFNSLNRNDVGKTVILASEQTYNAPQGTPLSVNVGTAEGDTISISIGAMNTVALGINELQVGDYLTNEASEGRVDNAIQTVISQRAELGAQEVALDYASSDAGNQYVQQVAAESSIRDLNVGQAVGDFTRQQILSNVGSSVLSQMEISTATLTNILVAGL